MEAIIQGEAHTSKNDRDALLDRISEDTDCVFIEGRADNISLDKITPGYAFFLAGMILYLGFIRYVRHLRMTPLEEELEGRGVAYCNEIDKEIPEIYRDMPEWPKYVFIGIYLIILAFLFQGDIPLFIRFGVFGISTLIGFILILFSPMAYFATVIQLEAILVGGRDETMATAITEAADKEGMNEILISCGQEHVDPIEMKLEDKRIRVKSHEGSHGYFWKSIDLINPITWFHVLGKYVNRVFKWQR